MERGLPVVPVLLGAALPLVLTLGGCAAAGRADAPPAPPVAPSTGAPSTGALPTAAAPDPPLPWPVGGPGVAVVQERVDAGAQPWLLDPESVATAFGAAAYGWPDASAELLGGHSGGGPELSVTLHGPGGTVAHLVLVQPGRTGPRGIWVVSRAAIAPGS
ncbi:MAG: hypothetical protein AB7J32_05970 [Pseudonocardia sp.]